MVPSSHRRRNYVLASPPPFHHDWRAGDIAFLKPSDQFSADDKRALIDSVYLHRGATGHPVIILRRNARSSHAVIIPITAYASSAENGYLAPWNQYHHRHKARDDFRAFNGSEPPNHSRPFLNLEPGQRMPKSETSWLHVQSVWVVPIRTLYEFTKSRGVLLRVCQDSLNDLKNHIAGSCRRFPSLIKDARLAHEVGESCEPPVPSQTALSPPARPSRPASRKPFGVQQAIWEHRKRQAAIVAPVR